jgi:hypothetical protein
VTEGLQPAIGVDRQFATEREGTRRDMFTRGTLVDKTEVP